MSDTLHDDDAPRRARLLQADINVTPLVDVVLVLLIIFMVVAPALESGAAVALPSATNPDRDGNQAVAPTVLSITREGAVYFEKTALTREQLAERLAALAQKDKDAKLILKADTGADYGAVRAIFKMCQDVGFPGISLQVIDQANKKAD